jgi:hypothetical protein
VRGQVRDGQVSASEGAVELLKLAAVGEVRERGNVLLMLEPMSISPTTFNAGSP